MRRSQRPCIPHGLNDPMGYDLRDFGSYVAGGRIHEIETGEPRDVQVTRDRSFSHDPRGHFAVEHSYVQFFVPSRRNRKPTVVLVHGGGLHGSTWETTPDGRPGWLHLLLQQGYEVHVVDAVERGRAGWVPNLWDGEPIMRSMEQAWWLFRFGPPEGFRDRRAYAGQQFPITFLETFARSFTPRWLSTTSVQSEALVAVLDRIGPAVLIAHSQGGEVAFDAQASRPDLVAGIIAVEPSAAPREIGTLADCPTLVMVGDFLDADENVRARRRLWSRLTDPSNGGARVCLFDTPTEVAPGGSHMLMMDRHNRGCLYGALEALGPH